MSVASEINRIKSNIADAYDEAESKGATMPATENSANLAQTVASIPEAVQPTLITKQINENGTYTAADDNADGYDEVEVAVPDGSKALLNALIDRTITSIVTDANDIAGQAFSYCTSLISFTSTNAKNIRNLAFDGCSSLVTADINNEVLTIFGYAFRNCRSLTHFVMPSKIRLLYNDAFYNNPNMQYVDMSYVEAIPQTMGSSPFGNSSCPILFKDQAQLDEYASATNWAALADRFQIKGATT